MPLPALTRLLVLSALWGASFLFMRITAPELGAFSTAFFRVLFGTIGLIAILAALRVPWNFRGKAGAALLIGVVNSRIPFAMFSLAAQVLPAGYSAMFNATTPLMGLLIGAVLFAEPLTCERVIGVGFGLVGVGVLVQMGPVPLSTSLLLGALACLIAASGYGLAGFLVKRFITDRGGLDSRLLALGSQIGASLALAPWMLAETATRESHGAWTQLNIWAAMLVLGLACTSLAYLLYFRLLQDLGPVKPLTVTMLVPLFGVFWGALFLDETITFAHALGGLLIAIALWLILFKKNSTLDVSKRGR
ncbi:DMT family transporter [Chromohalobacter sp. 11-W]|uniref:DMT family transporter n=1 Tax=Chromohalobacter sp. 11-W TaxID=2994061 RepID=UPI00246937B6|nr:DMT family transporter [Chromohalobacter sp. 11-W]